MSLKLEPVRWLLTATKRFKPNAPPFTAGYVFALQKLLVFAKALASD